MKAARFYARNDIRIENIPEPDVGPRGVKVEIEWCGICGTDLHEFHDGPVFCPTPDEPNSMTGETAPVVLGHEFVGVVVEVGADVTRARVGERVAVEPRLVCGECEACRAGFHNACTFATTIGLGGGGGGLAEYITVDEDLAFRIGDLPSDTAALIEPLAVAYHASGRSGVKPGDSALVFGAGPIGLLITRMLKALGASKVILVEPSSTRRARGTEVGADALVDPTQQDVQAVVAQVTGGAGVDVAFECAGVDPALQGCVDAIKARGTIVNVAIRSQPVTVDILPLILKEAHLVGTICYANDFPPVIELLQNGKLDVSSLITKRIRLDDLVAEGIETLLHDNESHVKILVSPR
jgi:(R,R)-butanediol dehydrogenase/meso-butanediol dehydrogenase/diacetyl reductase